MQRLFKVLGSDKRIEIIKFLLEKEEFTCVCELDEVINRDRSVAYRHFKKLESVGVIKTRKRGKRVEGKIKKPKKIRKLFKISKEEFKDEN